MLQPKRIEDLTVEDLRHHRWCYFHDDENGFDAFEHVISDAHPRFNESVIELELATFEFQGGEKLLGMFDGSKCFTVFLDGEWFSLWHGVAVPSKQRVAQFADALSRLHLSLPVQAVAKWSGATEVYCGLRHYDTNYNEVEEKF